LLVAGCWSLVAGRWLVVLAPALVLAFSFLDTNDSLTCSFSSYIKHVCAKFGIL
jgi:hypothetical protein